jgi:hypothetical protein
VLRVTGAIAVQLPLSRPRSAQVECWAILIMGVTLVAHGRDGCKYATIIVYQLIQLVAEFLTDVVCYKRLIRKGIHPVQAHVKQVRLMPHAWLLHKEDNTPAECPVWASSIR